MLQHLIDFDQHLFHLINRGLTNPVFDVIMPWVSNKKNWIPLYVLIIAFCLWRYRWWGFAIIIGIALSAGVADFTSASLIKPVVHRLRPCRDPATAATDIERGEGCGGGYSFPSSHATDHFAMAIFMALVWCKRWHWIWLWAILWAGLICFSRVYVGVHFPIDVISGALYGSLTGWLVSLLYYKVTKSYGFEA
jgi:membrane-associated phospholipid phosphatase